MIRFAGPSDPYQATYGSSDLMPMVSAKQPAIGGNALWLAPHAAPAAASEPIRPSVQLPIHGLTLGGSAGAVGAAAPAGVADSGASSQSAALAIGDDHGIQFDDTGTLPQLLQSAALTIGDGHGIQFDGTSTLSQLWPETESFRHAMGAAGFGSPRQQLAAGGTVMGSPCSAGLLQVDDLDFPPGWFTQRLAGAPLGMPFGAFGGVGSFEGSLDGLPMSATFQSQLPGQPQGATAGACSSGGASGGAGGEAVGRLQMVERGCVRRRGALPRPPRAAKPAAGRQLPQNPKPPAPSKGCQEVRATCGMRHA